MATYLEIEQHLDLEVADSEVDRWFKERVALGEVVDHLLALLARQAGSGEPSA